jgi:hypothetical protein
VDQPFSKAVDHIHLNRIRCLFFASLRLSLKTAVENLFTAKPQRAQRT